jgi:hypothetical protein
VCSEEKEFECPATKEGGENEEWFLSAVFLPSKKKKNALSLSLRFFLPDENET